MTKYSPPRYPENNYNLLTCVTLHPVNRECGTEVTTEENFIVYKNAIVGEYLPEEGTNFVGNRTLEVKFSCGFETDVDVNTGGISVQPSRRRRNARHNG